MKTSDIWFASYLKMKGYSLTDYNVISRGKGVFFFNITKEQWKLEKIELFSSDISKIKQGIEEIKDLLY